MWHRVFGQWWRAINGVPVNCTYVGVGDSLNGERARARALHVPKSGQRKLLSYIAEGAASAIAFKGKVGVQSLHNSHKHDRSG